MKILIVEDDVDYVKYISSDIKKINDRAEFWCVGSRDSATQLLASHYFDLIVLDLNIPTVDGAVDAEPVHGNLVFNSAIELAPGTPIFVLTGSPAAPFIGKLTASVQQQEIWGVRRMPTVEFLEKYNFGDQFPEKIRPYLDEFNAIFDVEVDRGVEVLSGQEHRLMRIFSRRSNALRCSVKKLGGGLSGAKVFRLTLTDHQGVLVYNAIAKIGPKKDVFDESAKFDRYVSRLGPDATPRKLGVLEFGAGNVCGIFYSLAAGFESDAFSIVMRNDAGAETMIDALRNMVRPWIEGVPQSNVSVGSLRAQQIPDEKFWPLVEEFKLSWAQEFERKNIQVVNACGHGDLHGFNILTNAADHPILIDYGDVGQKASCVDPITLEFSVFFHQSGPLKDSEWPSLDQAEHWGDLDLYLVDSPAPRFFVACRRWALATAAGRRELAAVAYGYLFRQLKYPETNKERLLAFLNGARHLFDETT